MIILCKLGADLLGGGGALMSGFQTLIARGVKVQVAQVEMQGGTFFGNKFQRVPFSACGAVSKCQQRVG